MLLSFEPEDTAHNDIGWRLHAHCRNTAHAFEEVLFASVCHSKCILIIVSFIFTLISAVSYILQFVIPPRISY